MANKVTVFEGSSIRYSITFHTCAIPFLSMLFVYLKYNLTFLVQLPVSPIIIGIIVCSFTPYLIFCFSITIIVIIIK